MTKSKELEIHKVKSSKILLNIFSKTVIVKTINEKNFKFDDDYDALFLEAGDEFRVFYAGLASREIPIIIGNEAKYGVYKKGDEWFEK